MRIIDVDAHVHEPLDWVERTDPALAAELGPPARFMDIASSVFGFADSSFAQLPEAQRPRDRFDLVPPGFVHHLELTDALQPDDHAGRGDDPFYGPEARLAFCDERGIDVQFLNPTFLVGAFVQAARARRSDLAKPIRRAWNSWAIDNVAGHTDRLIPVTQIDLADVEWSLAEMERMRSLGSKAFVLPEAPVTGARVEGGGRALAKSITHPDFEPIWDAAEDLGMAAFAHVGFARERINPPLPATHPIQGVIEQIPPEILCFSSDYPHVEGGASAVELCARQLANAGVSDDVTASFFGGVGELLGV